MTRKHLRFALSEVSFAGTPMPGATMDCWEDSGGVAQWSVRVVTRTNPTVDDGEFRGRTADGRVMSGHVVVADRQVGPTGRREMLVVFHGSGDLSSLAKDPG